MAISCVGARIETNIEVPRKKTLFAIIKQEYIHVPTEVYIVKRPEALTKLTEGRIYKTDYFHNLFENKALLNV